MKKFFLIMLFGLFFNNPIIAQGPPAPPCDCCTDLEPEEGEAPDQAYTDCVNECLAGNDPCIPIDSSIILLLIAGISLAFFYTNKKRLLEN